MVQFFYPFIYLLTRSFLSIIFLKTDKDDSARILIYFSKGFGYKFMWMSWRQNYPSILCPILSIYLEKFIFLLSCLFVMGKVLFVNKLNLWYKHRIKNMHLVTCFSFGHILYESIDSIDNIRSFLPRDPPWNKWNTISIMLSVQNTLLLESLFSISQADSFLSMYGRTFLKNQHFSPWKTPSFSLVS